MDRHENVAFRAVGYIAAPLKGNKIVIIACEDDFRIRHPFLNQLSESLAHSEIDRLFVDDFSDGTMVMPTVSRIDDYAELTLGGSQTDGRYGRQHHGKQELSNSRRHYFLEISHKISQNSVTLLSHCEHISLFDQ